MQGGEEVVWRTPNRSRSSWIEEDVAGLKRVAMSVVSASSQVRRVTLMGSSPTRPTKRTCLTCGNVLSERLWRAVFAARRAVGYLFCVSPTLLVRL